MNKKKEKEKLKSVLSQFTTQKDGFLYEKFNNSSFRKKHPEAIWFFEAYDNACKNCIEETENLTYKSGEAVQARSMMTEYLMNQLSAVAMGIDIDFLIALSGEMQEQRSVKNLSICLLPSEKVFRQHISGASIVFKDDDKKTLCLDKVHAVRKQLDLSADGGLAICRCEETCELRTVGVLDKEEVCIFPRIVLKRHLEWEFHMPTKKEKWACRLRYRQGTLMMPLLDMAKDQKATIRKMLRKMNCAEKEKVAKVVAALLPAIGECDHGAIVIFTEKEVASYEAERLASKGRGLMLPDEKPLYCQNGANKTLLKRMAAIDGAILADLDGNCYAYGVILDGRVTDEANNKDRGARYNSTKTYISSLRKNTKSLNNSDGEVVRIGVVRSEDGMMDIFPG